MGGVSTLVEVGEGTGLIRLHSTYRHDLKIYSSDEGRVQVGRALEREGDGDVLLTTLSPLWVCQMSAAAFTKGLLDLEGPLTPILVCHPPLAH